MQYKPQIQKRLHKDTYKNNNELSQDRRNTEIQTKIHITLSKAL